MIIDGKNHFIGAYDVLRPKADYTTLQEVPMICVKVSPMVLKRL